MGYLIANYLLPWITVAGALLPIAAMLWLAIDRR
jgi:hypothetical protein